jgi:hypothetical protein
MESVYKLNDESWIDDESYAPYYDDESYYANDDESILGNLGNAIKSGVSAVGSILTGNPLGAAKSVGTAIGNVLGVNPVPAITAGIQQASNLSGQIMTAAGKAVPFKLPQSVATKQDITILQSAIQRINSEIKKVADTTTNNGQALTKLAKDVKLVDDKHTLATKKQNELISRLGVTSDKLQKAVDSIRSQNQMSMFMPMLMQPKLESIKFENRAGANVVADGTTEYDVESSKSTDNSMLFMLMAMQGNNQGSGNSGGGFGDFASNPMMMYFMMDAFNK